MSAPITTARRRRWQSTLRVFLGRGVVVSASAALFLGFVVVALAADLIAPYDPNLQDLTGALAVSSPEHWLGQDHLGRDILSRIIHGGRVSLAVSFLSGTLAALLGITLGLIAGYRGGHIGCCSSPSSAAACSVSCSPSASVWSRPISAWSTASCCP
jgi:peptide/nickel transport system permease protein